MLLPNSFRKKQSFAGIAILEFTIFLSMSLLAVFSVLGIVNYFEESRSFRTQLQDIIQQQLLSSNSITLKDLSVRSKELPKEKDYAIEILLYKVHDINLSLLERRKYGDKLFTIKFDQKKVADLISLQGARRLRFLREKYIRKKNILVVRGVINTTRGFGDYLVRFGILPESQSYEKIIII